VRYIVQEPILTTVTDDELFDLQTIRDILSHIKNMQYAIHLSYEDTDTQFIRALDNVRITDINFEKNTINIHAFLSAATVKYTDIPIGNLRKIRMISSRADMAKKYKVNRFQMIEVADLSEI